VKTRLANPTGFTTAKWTPWSAQSSLGAEDGRQACKVDERKVVKVEDEQSGAVEVNAVERAQQVRDGGKVKVSCHPEDQHRVGALHGQAVATGRAIRLRPPGPSQCARGRFEVEGDDRELGIVLVSRQVGGDLSARECFHRRDRVGSHPVE